MGEARPGRSPEIRVCGRHACRAVFERRPGDVLRVFLTHELTRAFGDVLRHCAARRLPYRVVSPGELATVSQSVHHEGICVVARPRPEPALRQVLAPPGPGALLALAGVSNPHNVGAILRTAAHFGARGVLLGGEARLPPAAYRTSQGGAEWVEALGAPDLASALEACGQGGFIRIATSSHGGQDLFAAHLPARSVFLLGAEDEGLPPALLRAADLRVAIPGTGRVESLNVATAAGVLLAEHWRCHGGGTPGGAGARGRVSSPAVPR